MDNLCHTLVGLGLAESGLKRKTALGTATLLVGANLPDVDGFAYAWGPVTALGFRRGWTHGVLAIAVWPLVLAGLMLAWDRGVRRRREPGAAPSDPWWLVVLAAMSVTSHPLLDFLNTYGVRFLMPFSDRWFYGDTLFIVDPWIWILLLAGAIWSRWQWSKEVPRAGGPARVALVLTLTYALAMAALNVAGRRLVETAQSDRLTIRHLMTAPVPANPFQRDVVMDTDRGYLRTSIAWLERPSLGDDWDVISTGDSTSEARAAAATSDGRTYLRWARFPVFQVERQRGGALVRISDARYPGQSWAEVAIPVNRPLSLPRTTPAPERP